MRGLNGCIENGVRILFPIVKLHAAEGGNGINPVALQRTPRSTESECRLSSRPPDVRGKMLRSGYYFPGAENGDCPHFLLSLIKSVYWDFLRPNPNLTGYLEYTAVPGLNHLHFV